MKRQKPGFALPDYSESPANTLTNVLHFLIGFVAMFAIIFIFYKLIPLSIVGGIIYGAVNIVVASRKAAAKRKLKLRAQFFDLLEAMSVSMRAGSNELLSLQSARKDMLLLYPEDSDIVVELDAIIAKFQNSVPLSESFADFAQRSGLEDIGSFASIYKTIEGKSSRADQIVRQTQAIIADKLEIEMEIDTLMTAAKSEVNIMLFLPLVILGIIGYMGAGFMDAIYTTAAGRVVATFGVAIFIVSYILARKFSSITL